MFDEPFHGSRGPASAPILEGHAESFISPAALCARRAGRSAADRLLCKQEVLGSNPSRSTPVPYLPRFKSTLRTVPDLGLGSSAWPCASHGTWLLSGTECIQWERGQTTLAELKGRPPEQSSMVAYRCTPSTRRPVRTSSMPAILRRSLLMSRIAA